MLLDYSLVTYETERLVVFTILIRSPYIEIDAFYPYEGWNDDLEKADRRDDEGNVTYRDLVERCMSVDLSDETDLEELIDIITDPGGDYLSGVEMAVSGCDASIKVDDDLIANPFSDYEKYEVPELDVLIPDLINLKFCFVKVWENSGEWFYKGDGEFDLSKLTWVKGRFFYDGNEFDFIGGEGSSSYTCFYKDGEVVG